VESLFNIHETLASILRELNYDTPATYRRTPQYLKMICGLSNCFIIIDEASDLDTRVWPYLKRISEYKDIQQEAIEQIYMAVKCDMRKFQEICTDCRDRAKELKYQFVDINLALEFISDLPPQ
jgi:hypothetical protein